MGVQSLCRGVALVVDDDEGIRAELSAILEEEGYLVIESSDGADAERVLRSKAGAAVRLIVLDLVMPRTTGWELLEILRRDQALSAIPILVTSGVPVHGDASGIGATLTWLRKPFGREEFLSAVREAVESKRRLPPREGDGASEFRPSSPSFHDR